MTILFYLPCKELLLQIQFFTTSMVSILFCCRCIDVRQTCASSNTQLEQMCIRLLCPELRALESRLASGILREEKRNQLQQSLYSKDFLNGPESDIGLSDLNTPSGFFNTGRLKRYNTISPNSVCTVKIKNCIEILCPRMCSEQFESTVVSKFGNSFW